MKIFALLLSVVPLLASSFGFGPAWVDLSPHVRPVHAGDKSTGLSIYDTNPESPDGNYICYIHYPGIVQGGHRAGVVLANVMIKHRLTGETRRLCETRVTNHNGANVFWVDNSKVAVMGNYLEYFEVYNVETGESLFGPVKGELGHKSFGNEIIYSAANLRLRHPNKFRAGFHAAEEGLHRLNVTTGVRERIVSLEAIHAAFRAQNPRVTEAEVEILHVEPSPDNRAIMFDFRQPGTGSLHGYVRADGTGIRWVPVRPMHVVWYDNDTMFGVDTKELQKRIYRFDLQGNKLELLGGTATHVGASPDRKWYVAESAYYQPEPDGFTRVYLYKKGREQPVALLAEWRNKRLTWDWVAHVNPAFSADGKRVYFLRASDDKDRFDAVFVDLSEHLDALN